MNAKKRVVVTGLGAVTPIGLDVPAYWEGLKSGTLGIGEITSFSLEDFPVKIAAEITDYDPKKTLDKKAFKRMDRMSQLAMTAAKEAFADADLPGAYAPERAGVILGNGIGGILSLTDSHVNLLNKGPSRVSPFFCPHGHREHGGRQYCDRTGPERPEHDRGDGLCCIHQCHW